ncbi:DUF5672 family protein [Mucilaginibacter segetis]|uniref:DUF5672 domain-containing protein n=1 Tax=Mucilaginibacter segetis TaxID=2793071 RepID=A0A934PV66_9SPHI|nr:DUF5672 family protein [Mucilaginibacter segetis]MBK0380654.1 hypothetical protein [Mucilaginibacter segetis]
MDNKRKICVIIPVHKAAPQPDELIALNACKKHLSSHNCYLIFPQGMDTSAYTAAFEGLLLKPVDPGWLASVEQYNKMKLNLEFYRLFAAYNYMVTYELDAYIFSQDLENAGAFDFDFIGAPFFEGYWEAKPGAKLVHGCNSGFSVRNINSCIRALSGMKKFRFRWLLYRLFLSHSSRLRLKLNGLTKGRLEVFITGRFGFYFADFHLNEDVVWTEVIPKLFPWFKVADPITALNFSFEYNLEDSLKLNKGRLPLGCHAWYKHLEFWSRYIDTRSIT